MTTPRVNENDINSANTRRSRSVTRQGKAVVSSNEFGTITVVPKSSKGKVSVYHIEDNVTYLGSDPDCHVRINNPAVISRHAKIEVDLGSLVITDLTAAGGVIVNGNAIKGDRVLANGDTVKIGDRSFVIGCPKVPYKELPNKERKKTMGPRILRSMTSANSTRRRSVSHSLCVHIAAEDDTEEQEKEGHLAPASAANTNQDQTMQVEEEKSKRLSQVTYLQLPKETEQLVSERQIVFQKDLNRASTPKSAIKSASVQEHTNRKSVVRFVLPALDEEEEEEQKKAGPKLVISLDQATPDIGGLCEKAMSEPEKREEDLSNSADPPLCHGTVKAGNTGDDQPLEVSACATVMMDASTGEDPSLYPPEVLGTPQKEVDSQAKPRRLAKRRNSGTLDSQTPMRRDFAQRIQDRKQSSRLATIVSRSGDLIEHVRPLSDTADPCPKVTPFSLPFNLDSSNVTAAVEMLTAAESTPRKAKRKRSVAPQTPLSGCQEGDLDPIVQNGPADVSEQSTLAEAMHEEEQLEQGPMIKCTTEPDSSAAEHNTGMVTNEMEAEEELPPSCLTRAPPAIQRQMPTTPQDVRTVNVGKRPQTMTPAPMATKRIRHTQVMDGPASATRPSMRSDVPHRKVLQASTREKRSQRRIVAGRTEQGEGSLEAPERNQSCKSVLSGLDEKQVATRKRQRLDTLTQREIESKAASIAERQQKRNTSTAPKITAVVRSRLATPIKNEIKNKAHSISTKRSTAATRRLNTPLRRQIQSTALSMDQKRKNQVKATHQVVDVDPHPHSATEEEEHDATQKEDREKQAAGGLEEEEKKKCEEEHQKQIALEQRQREEREREREKQEHEEKERQDRERAEDRERQEKYEREEREREEKEKQKRARDDREVESGMQEIAEQEQEGKEQQRLSFIEMKSSEEGAENRETETNGANRSTLKKRRTLKRRAQKSQLQEEQSSPPSPVPIQGKRKRKDEVASPEPLSTSERKPNLVDPDHEVNQSSVAETLQGSEEAGDGVDAVSSAEQGSKKPTKRRVAIRRKGRTQPKRTKKAENEPAKENEQTTDQTQHILESKNECIKEEPMPCDTDVSEDTVVDGRRIGDMICVQLKASLKKRGLPTGGLKAALIARLIECLRAERLGNQEAETTERLEAENSRGAANQPDRDIAENDEKEEEVAQPRRITAKTSTGKQNAKEEQEEEEPQQRKVVRKRRRRY